MRKRLRTLFSTAAMVMMIGAIFFAGKPQPSAGQNLPEPNRKPACSIFCGDGTFNSITLAKPPACFGGPLPAGDAGNHYKNLSKEGRSALCQSLNTPGRTDSSCPAFKTLSAACEQDKKESPENKCESPAPHEMRCDCDNDGKDEIVENFKSCGPKVPPRSRCEEWVRMPFYGGYMADYAIEAQGQEAIYKLIRTCPSLKCELQKHECITRANPDVSYPDPLVYPESCKRNFEHCIKNIGKRPPEPLPPPQPLPQPVPVPSPRG